MTEGIPQDDQSLSKLKIEQQSKEKASSIHYPTGQGRQELSIDTLKAAAESERQRGDTKEAQALQKIIDLPTPPQALAPQINKPPTQTNTPRRDIPRTTYYPAGQGRQNLEHVPIPSTPTPKNRGSQGGGK